MAGISERLKKLRKEHRLTQKDVADFLGITESGYGYYEQGRNEPSIQILKKLSNKYSVTIDFIIGESDDPTPRNSRDSDSLSELNVLLKKYELDQSGFLDIENWKVIGTEGSKQIERYFQFILQEAKKQKEKS